jgi:hypothetical protein
MMVPREVVAASRTTNRVAFLINMDLARLVDPLSCGLVHDSRLVLADGQSQNQNGPLTI